MSNTGVYAIRIAQVIMCACYNPSILICCLRLGMACQSLVNSESTDGVEQQTAVLVEADNGIPIMEADSKPIVEVDWSKPIVEAESKSVTESGLRPVL